MCESAGIGRQARLRACVSWRTGSKSVSRTIKMPARTMVLAVFIWNNQFVPYFKEKHYDKVFVFDFDGTLVDSQDVLLDIYNQLAGKYKANKIDPKDFEYIKDCLLLKDVNF